MNSLIKSVEKKSTIRENSSFSSLSVTEFQNAEFGTVRTAEIEGKIYFCGSDVATCLGYKLARKAILDHCKGVLKWNTLTKGGNQLLSYIPEGDVYRLIAHSKLESAQKFESWVFDEVLPTIRKTGSYFATPKTFAEALRLAADQQEKIEAQQKQLAITQPKADVYDELVSRDYVKNFRDTAAYLGITQKAFMTILRSKYIYKTKSNEDRAYSEYAEYFKLRPFKVGEKEKEQLMVTVKGLEYFKAKYGKKETKADRLIESMQGKTEEQLKLEFSDRKSLRDFIYEVAGGTK